MKTKSLIDFNIKQLREELAEERISYLKLKLSHAVTPLENPMRIKTSRLKIARLSTELRAKLLTQFK